MSGPRNPEGYLCFTGYMDECAFLAADHIVAIDSCIPRKPPAKSSSAEDKLVRKVSELLLNRDDVARTVLDDILQIQDNEGDFPESKQPIEKAFQSGVRDCLGKVLKIKVGRRTQTVNDCCRNATAGQATDSLSLPHKLGFLCYAFIVQLVINFQQCPTGHLVLLGAF